MKHGGKSSPQKDVKRILEHAISPYDFYCEGFGNNDSKGCYIASPIIAAGKANPIPAWLVVRKLGCSRNHGSKRILIGSAYNEIV